MIEKRQYQKQAVESLLKHDRGYLIAPTGSGKTIIAILLAMEINANTLIIVPTKRLVDQTIEKFEKFTNIKPSAFSKNKKLSKITITTWQSMTKAVNSDRLAELKSFFGCIIADEFHKAGAEKYLEIIETINCKYIYGLTATPYRADDNIKLLQKICNQNETIIDIDTLYEQRMLIKPEIQFVITPFEYKESDILNGWQISKFDFSQKMAIVKSTIAADNDRNDFIINKIKQKKGNNIIVLSFTRCHAEILYDKFNFNNYKKYMIHGGLKKKEKDLFFSEIDQEKQPLVIFATQSFLGEGIDIPKLDTLHLISPFGGNSKPIQFCGRILRVCEGKKTARIFDYVDNIDIAKYLWQARKKYYQKIKPNFRRDDMTDVLIERKKRYNKVLKREKTAHEWFNNPDIPIEKKNKFRAEYEKILKELNDLRGFIKKYNVYESLNGFSVDDKELSKLDLSEQKLF